MAMDAKAALANKRGDIPVLRPEETALARSIISLGIYWKGVAVLILAIIVMILAFPLGAFLSVVALIIFGFEYLMRHNLLMVVTDQRILIRFGIILVDTIHLRFDRIESVELQTTPPGQIFGYSTVIVTGTGTRLAMIPFIANALEIQMVINDLLHNRDMAARENIEANAQIQAQAIADALQDNGIKPQDD